MLVDVYRSRRDPRQFASVPAGADLSSLDLVAKGGSAYQGMDLFMKGMDTSGTPRAGFNAPAIKGEIGGQGFSLHYAEVVVSSEAIGTRPTPTR